MRLTFFIAILLATTGARGEVLDKEFPLSLVLGVALVSSVVAFFAARRCPWSLAFLLPIMAVFFALHLSELMDPVVGPLMAAEGGLWYVFGSWIAPLAVVMSTAYGFALRRLPTR